MFPVEEAAELIGRWRTNWNGVRLYMVRSVSYHRLVEFSRKVQMTRSSKKPDTAPNSKPSELTAKQRYLMKKLSEAGLLTPLLEDLSRNIKLAQTKPGGKGVTPPH